MLNKSWQLKDMILQRSNSQELMLCVNNRPVALPVRMPNQGERVIIDYVNFVVDIHDITTKHDKNTPDYISELVQLDTSNELSDDERIIYVDYVAHDIGERLAYIFGYDIDDVFSKLSYTGRGLHSYKYCLNIGSRENPIGKVCFGGQNNTVLVMISGLGCALACVGWEQNLYDFLKGCKKASISRIDLAHDDFNGAYSSVDDADKKESEGFFHLISHGTKPKVQQLGDWKYNLGDGRTLQVGKRQNGKMFRGYEKGRQLGDTSSLWFRAEVELRNQGHIIPFDILINPTEYFTGFYPYTAKLIDDCIAYEQRQAKCDNPNDKADSPDGQAVKSIRIPLIVKSGEISLKKSLEVWKTQIGRYIKFYRDFFKDDTLILDLLQTPKKHDCYPKRLSILEKFKSGEFLASLPSHQPLHATLGITT